MNLYSFAYFGLHRAIGSSVRAYYREMKSIESWSPERLESLQQERLRNLLTAAASRVPYYRERLLPEAGLTLQEFPIMTKAALKKEFLNLMTPELRQEYETGRKAKSYSWVKVQTGGTTGEPTTVIHEAACRDSGRAGRLYSQDLCGFPLGTPYVKLWGDMRDINESRDSYTQKTLRSLHRETVLNAFRMGKAKMDEYLTLIARSGAKHLMGYVDAIEELASYAKKANRKIPQIETIMACAGTVTPHARKILEETFGARVHNQYGSRECAGIACECERGRHHVYANRLVLEVVDDAGRQVRPGTSGRLLVTMLQNPSFPMIRYEIGDVGALSLSPCECGRPYPALSNVEGRSGEFLISTDGGYVSPVYIRHLVGVVHNPGLIRRFQIEQTARENFELRCEMENGQPESLEKETLNKIFRDLQRVLGAAAQIRISRVAEIPPAASGKFQYSVNRTKTN